MVEEVVERGGRCSRSETALRGEAGGAGRTQLSFRVLVDDDLVVALGVCGRHAVREGEEESCRRVAGGNEGSDERGW